jgi:ParB family chromosome partitioning protein
MGTTFEMQTVDPTTLLVDVNVRSDLNLTPEFIASVKDHGVLVPIVAVKTTDGLRVRMGHRRTVAAVEAGRTSVPVVVTDDEVEGDAGEIERLLTQHAENHHRAGLTVADDANVAKQLSLLGMSVASIAKRTGTKKAHVETALSVAASELASKATERYDLTLDQAAVVAEFEDDTEVVTALVASIASGRFDHVAQRARNDRAEAEAKAPAIAALAEVNVPVVARPHWQSDAKSLDGLVTKDREDITVESHAKCPGHAAYLRQEQVYVDADGTPLPTNQWGDVQFDDDVDEEEADKRLDAATVLDQWVPEYVCTDWKANGHSDRHERETGKVKPEDKTDAEREADKKARALVIENNKAWKAAREVRGAWLKTFLTRKTPPATAGPFLAVALTRDADISADVKGNSVAAEWFGATTANYGRSSDLVKVAEGANDKRAIVIALGTVLGGYEARATDGAWRENGDHSSTGRYLRFLATNGYVLSDVEVYAASKKTA